MASDKPNTELENLLLYIKQNRGFDFTGYKRTSLERRVRKRMQEVDVDGFANYLDYLEVHPEEFIQLFNTILINVTAFFRDAAAWHHIADEIIPQLLAGKEAGEPIRMWSAGCASGEEAYTLAILMAEALGLKEALRRVKIYATDVDEEALVQARQATYTSGALRALPEAWRDQYFKIVRGRYVLHADLRRMVIFGRHDLVQDSPISRLDLLVCRNTLMYFNAEIQSRILARFHFALNNNGVLFLGRAEMLLTHTNLFMPVNLPYRIFTKVPHVALRDRLLVLAEASNEGGHHRLIRHTRLREVLFDTTPMAQIVVDASGILVLANAQARTMCGLSPQDLGRVFQDLTLSYRPVELRSLIDQAISTCQVVPVREVEWPVPEAEPRFMDLRVVPLIDNDGSLLGVNMTFTDVTPSHRLQKDLERSKQDLETAYEELQSTNEEMETTNEELQSTVEELETANEELQSTNEEMETMNEEIQSTNEELRTSNDELRQNSLQLDRINAFFHAILSSMQSGVVVLDADLHIEVWNDKAQDLWGLRSDEVEGQFFLNLDIGLPVEQLKGPLRDTLDGKIARQEIVLPARNRRGQTMQCRIIYTPLHGPQHRIDGAVLIMEEWHHDHSR